MKKEDKDMSADFVWEENARRLRSYIFKNLKGESSNNGKTYSVELIHNEDSDFFRDGMLFSIMDKRLTKVQGITMPIFHNFVYKNGKLSSIKTYSSNNSEGDDEITPFDNTILMMGSVFIKER